MSTNDVQAGPSPAPTEGLPDFQTMPRTDYENYLKTGDLPKETKAPTSDTEPESGQTTDTAKSGAASDAADTTTKTQENTPKPPNREERRNQKLNNENRELKARLEALEKAKDERGSERHESAEADDEPGLEDTNPDGTPKYKTVKEWQKVHSKWRDDREDARIDKVLRTERERIASEAQAAEAEKAGKTLATTFVERVKEHRKTLKEDTFVEDYTEMHALLNGKHEELAQAILDSELGPQLVTYFGEHFDELESMAKMPLASGLRALIKLESSEKVKGPAPNTRTAAKKIGSHVGGSHSVSDEDAEIQAAAESGDMQKYTRLMNKREAAETRR